MIEKDLYHILNNVTPLAALSAVYIPPHTDKFRLVQWTRARRAHAGTHVQSPTCPLHRFCTFLAFMLEARAQIRA